MSPSERRRRPPGPSAARGGRLRRAAHAARRHDTLEALAFRYTASVPFEYVTGLIDLLARHRDVFRVMTYDDMMWGRDHDHEGYYPDEWRRWNEWAQAFGRDRIHVLIQHDVDALPELSMLLVEYELSAGTPSNVMVFNRLVDRTTLAKERRLVEIPYPLDGELLATATREERFVVGYHTNAVERAGWDLTRAEEVFEEDVAELRRRFDVRYFSPHGGVPGPQGENNFMIRPPAGVAEGCRWVHNKWGARFHAHYSDGALTGSSRDPNDLDVRDFVRSWVPGCRYRILIHPQYYGSPVARHPDLSRAGWYTRLIDDHESGARDLWEGVWPEALGGAPPATAAPRRPEPPRQRPVAAPRPAVPPLDPAAGSPFGAIAGDFGMVGRVARARVLEIGPGGYEFAEALWKAGARDVVTIDRDPEVVAAGRSRGFESVLVDLRHLTEHHGLGSFDVVFCRGAFNAYWFGARPEEQRPWIAALATLVAEGGAAWIAAWNAPSAAAREWTDAQHRELLDDQVEAFADAGFRAISLDGAFAARYGVGGPTVRNCPLFVRGVDPPSGLAGAAVATRPAS